MQLDHKSSPNRLVELQVGESPSPNRSATPETQMLKAKRHEEMNQSINAMKATKAATVVKIVKTARHKMVSELWCVRHVPKMLGSLQGLD